MSGKAPLYAAIVLAGLVVAAGWATLAAWWGPVVLLLTTAAWLVGERRRWRWPGYAGLFLLTIIAAIGLQLGMSPAWAILGVVLALAAWEMSHFHRFLAGVAAIDDVDDLVQRHQRRLLFASVVAVALAGLAVTVRISLSFGVALLLAILALIGLGRALHFLRQESHG